MSSEAPTSARPTLPELGNGHRVHLGTEWKMVVVDGRGVEQPDDRITDLMTTRRSEIDAWLDAAARLETTRARSWFAAAIASDFEATECRILGLAASEKPAPVERPLPPPRLAPALAALARSRRPAATGVEPLARPLLDRLAAHQREHGSWVRQRLDTHHADAARWQAYAATRQQRRTAVRDAIRGERSADGSGIGLRLLHAGLSEVEWPFRPRFRYGQTADGTGPILFVSLDETARLCWPRLEPRPDGRGLQRSREDASREGMRQAAIAVTMAGFNALSLYITEPHAVIAVLPDQQLEQRPIALARFRRQDMAGILDRIRRDMSAGRADLWVKL